MSAFFGVVSLFSLQYNLCVKKPNLFVAVCFLVGILYMHPPDDDAAHLEWFV